MLLLKPCICTAGIGILSCGAQGLQQQSKIQIWTDSKYQHFLIPLSNHWSWKLWFSLADCLDSYTVQLLRDLQLAKNHPMYWVMCTDSCLHSCVLMGTQYQYVLSKVEVTGNAQHINEVRWKQHISCSCSKIVPYNNGFFNLLRDLFSTRSSMRRPLLWTVL